MGKALSSQRLESSHPREGAITDRITNNSKKEKNHGHEGSCCYMGLDVDVKLRLVVKRGDGDVSDDAERLFGLLRELAA